MSMIDEVFAKSPIDSSLKERWKLASAHHDAAEECAIISQIVATYAVKVALTEALKPIEWLNAIPGLRWAAGFDAAHLSNALIDWVNEHDIGGNLWDFTHAQDHDDTPTHNAETPSLAEQNNEPGSEAAAPQRMQKHSIQKTVRAA